MSEPALRILVVDDERPIRRFLKVSLGGQHTVFEAANGEEALQAVTMERPDLIILDLGLPDMDGAEVTRRLREWTQIPIIVISVREREDDKIAALDAGADDYLTKPFSVDELLARIRVGLRRIRCDSEKLLKDSNIFINNNLKIDYTAGCVSIDDKEIHLTPIEYKLLCLLAKNIGKVLTHNFILHEIWGNYTNDVPALRVSMATLRKKMEINSSQPKYIQTHIGVGYRMLYVSNDSKSV